MADWTKQQIKEVCDRASEQEHRAIRAEKRASLWKMLAARLMQERDSAYRHDADKAARNSYLSAEWRKLNAQFENLKAEHAALEELHKNVATSEYKRGLEDGRKGVKAATRQERRRCISIIKGFQRNFFRPWREQLIEEINGRTQAKSSAD